VKEKIIEFLGWVFIALCTGVIMIGMLLL